MLQQSKWIINNFFKEIKKNKNSVILHIYHEEKTKFAVEIALLYLIIRKD